MILVQSSGDCDFLPLSAREFRSVKHTAHHRVDPVRESSRVVVWYSTVLFSGAGVTSSFLFCRFYAARRRFLNPDSFMSEIREGFVSFLLRWTAAEVNVNIYHIVIQDTLEVILEEALELREHHLY